MLADSSSITPVVSETLRSPRKASTRKIDEGKSSNTKLWNRSNPVRYSMQTILQRGKAFLTPRGSSQSLNQTGFKTVKEATSLFPPVDPTIDGEDCLHDCATCTVELPRKWSIEEDDKLFGHVKGWESHLIVATGKTDWVRDVTDEKGSLMESIGRVLDDAKQMEHIKRKVMLSASDMPPSNDTESDDNDDELDYPKKGRTRCLVLPGWKFVEGVNTDQVEWLMREAVGKGSSNVQMIRKQEVINPEISTADTDDDTLHLSNLRMEDTNGVPKPQPSLSLDPPQGISLRSCPHQAVILMCSHKTRDWRCGASAPLLRKEFERHLRPLGLYRDIHDERPGGVGVYFINHVGGHKYSANVMIYRREGRKSETNDSGEKVLSDEAVQGIWLARVRPEDCENIVKYTVLQGKLVKPQRQLRGGFDRETGLISW